MAEIISKVKSLIRTDKLGDAIKLLTTEIETKYDIDLSNKILLISRRLEELNSKIIKGNITSEKAGVDKSDIGDNLLKLLEEVEYSDQRISDTKNATNELRFLINKIKSNKGILSDDKSFLNDLKKIFIEIDNTYKIVSESVNKYLKPALSNDELDASPYLEYSNGFITMEIDQKRGHCHIISENYFKQDGVRDKLRELIKNDEVFNNFDELFSKLSDGDLNVFHRIQGIGYFIEEESGKIVEMLMENRGEKVKEKIREDFKKINPLKKILREGMKEISELKLELGF